MNSMYKREIYIRERLSLTLPAALLFCDHLIPLSRCSSMVCCFAVAAMDPSSIKNSEKRAFFSVM